MKIFNNLWVVTKPENKFSHKDAHKKISLTCTCCTQHKNSAEGGVGPAWFQIH